MAADSRAPEKAKDRAADRHRTRRAQAQPHEEAPAINVKGHISRDMAAKMNVATKDWTMEGRFSSTSVQPTTTAAHAALMKVIVDNNVPAFTHSAAPTPPHSGYVKVLTLHTSLRRWKMSRRTP